MSKISITDQFESSFEGLWNRIIGWPNWDVPKSVFFEQISTTLLTNSTLYSEPPPKITILYLPFYAAMMKWKNIFPFVLPIMISAQPKHAKSCAVWPWLCIFHFILAFYKWNLLHICKICKIVISIRNLMHGSALESFFDGLSNAIIGLFNQDKLKMMFFSKHLFLINLKYLFWRALK